MSLTVAQKENQNGFPKAGELIELQGAHELEASDRALMNLLYRHAFISGCLTTPGQVWAVDLNELRAISSHNSNDRIIDSLERLMRIVVRVVYREDGREEVLLTHLFDFFKLPKKRADGLIRFSIPRVLAPVLSRSTHWGRIKAEIVCALTSKYAIQLYELIQLRANLDRCVEVFSINEFRERMNVPPTKLLRGADFVRCVIEPALLEVNGLSDNGVQIELRRKHPKAPIHEVAVTWWAKEGDAYRSAVNERNRSKIGRMARLKGTVEASTV